MRVLKFFWRYLKKYKFFLVTIFVFMMVNALLGLVTPYISGMIVDEVIVNKKRELFLKLLVLLLSGVLFKSIARYFSLMLIERTTQDFQFDVRNEMYSRMQKMDFSYFDRTKTGDIMTRISGDLQVVRNFIAGSATVVFESLFSFVFVMILMVRMNFLFTILLLAVTPFIGYFTFDMTKKTKPLNSEWHEQVTRLNSVVQENISGNRVVKAFCNEDFEIRKFTKENEGYKNEYGKWVDIWKKYLPVINFLGGMMTVVIILVGGILVINGKLSYGQLVVFTGLSGTLSVPINMANWLSDQVQKFFASGEKIIELMTVEPKIADAENSIALEKYRGEIEFRNVSFSYNGERVLKNINMHVKPGQTVGIIGPTGSGKSTLVNLICRFYDCTEGEILVDGLNIKEIRKKSLRRNIAIAMQDTFLFSDTIEGNIAYGVPDAAIESVQRAAAAAGAHHFILELSDGYDTIVGERGVGLSGGQRQRVSLARALLKDAPIMIFDDITSSVDVETEQKIQESLKSVYSGKTTFIISHRISSVRNADIVFVLDKGQIIEQGTHRELLEKKGYYYSVFMIQSGKSKALSENLSENLNENLNENISENLSETLNETLVKL
ncbi:MAG: ABC transporter ATP-binding protein [Firmicutes bacterium]|nr:ABC transporter ATP-binding protein [Bacillota bacterium]